MAVRAVSATYHRRRVSRIDGRGHVEENRVGGTGTRLAQSGFFHGFRRGHYDYGGSDGVCKLLQKWRKEAVYDFLLSRMGQLRGTDRARHDSSFVVVQVAYGNARRSD